MQQPQIIIASNIKPRPNSYEIRVAEILADYFKSDIRFIPRSGRPTPDVMVVTEGITWEIKNIRGNGRHTIEDNLRAASKQSRNVVISLLKPTKMNAQHALSRIKFFLSNGKRGLRRILLITKQGKVIDIL